MIFQLAETLQPPLPQKSAGTTSLRNEMSARCLGATRRVGRQIRSRAKFNPQVLFFMDGKLILCFRCHMRCSTAFI
jgi:hypothetical protein